MVIRTCDICHYSTVYKHVFDIHCKSPRHLEKVMLANQAAPDTKIWPCPNCPKTYLCRSGLWRHRRVCKAPPPSAVTDASMQNIALLSRIAQLENELNKVHEPIPSPTSALPLPATVVSNATSDCNNTISTATNANNTMTNSNNTATVTTNTANNNITNNIHINYLNTNCKNAMSITEFVDSLVFTKDEIMMFLEDHYDVVVAKLIAKRLINLPVERRPFHCIPPTADASGYFAIKNDTWIQESQPKLEDHMYTAEEDEEYFSMITPGKLDDIRNKIYDAYEENRKTEPKLEPIRGRMTSGGATAGKVMILGHLMKNRLLKVPTG